MDSCLANLCTKRLYIMYIPQCLFCLPNYSLVRQVPPLVRSRGYMVVQWLHRVQIFILSPSLSLFLSLSLSLSLFIFPFHSLSPYLQHTTHTSMPFIFLSMASIHCKHKPLHCDEWKYTQAKMSFFYSLQRELLRQKGIYLHAHVYAYASQPLAPTVQWAICCFCV